jgi:hypothetical protein
MTYKKPDLAALQAECDAFNAACKVGGRVAVNLYGGSDKPIITTTRTEAQILSGHTSVVWMDGVSGCWSLGHVTPIPDGPAWAVYADNGNVRIWSYRREAVERVANECGKPVVPYTPPAPEWKPVTGAGQVRAGDRLRFTIGDKSYSERAKMILSAGTDKEEVIYDKGRNFYFITAMILSGFSNHKGVEFLAPQQQEAASHE